MSGVLEDGRKRQGRGEGGRSTEVELVCHDLPRKCIRHHCHVLERHLGGREVGREGGREGGREEGVGEHDRITSKPRLPLLFFPPSLPSSLPPSAPPPVSDRPCRPHPRLVRHPPTPPRSIYQRPSHLRQGRRIRPQPLSSPCSSSPSSSSSSHPSSSASALLKGKGVPRGFLTFLAASSWRREALMGVGREGGRV